LPQNIEKPERVLREAVAAVTVQWVSEWVKFNRAAGANWTENTEKQQSEGAGKQSYRVPSALKKLLQSVVYNTILN
jgi:hypothetical protein